MSITDLDFEVTTEEPPEETTRRGAPGKYDKLVELANEHAEKAAKAKKATPWIVFPKAGEDGKREASVGSQTFYNLRKRYGQNSPYHKKHETYFDVRLTERVTGGKNNSTTRGVLRVRRVAKPEPYVEPETDAEGNGAEA